MGGRGDDEGNGIAVDSSGNAYVVGESYSLDFPTTPGAFQTTFSGGNSDASVTKLNAGGSALVYSTYLGGSGYDFGLGIAVDAPGSAYVTGLTGSSDFPTTPGAFQTTLGNLYGNAFVSKLNAHGSALVYSTYLGGSGGAGVGDNGIGIGVDTSGSAYVTGITRSSDFPTTPGAFQTSSGGGNSDAFVTKLNAGGSALVYSTYLGGIGDDFGFSLAIDVSGNAYVTGLTGSSDFPTTPGAFQTTFGGGSLDAFVSKVNAAGSALLYSTYLGGSDSGYGGYGNGIAVDPSGDAYVTA